MNAGISSAAPHGHSLATDARARLDASDLSAAARGCLERFFAWGAAPTVEAYCGLFASHGTLLDADMAQPISGAAIRDSITGVLQLLPDFRFHPVRVVADGSQVFVLAANRATLGDRALVWDAVYALTLAGDHIAAGRRYYDRAALLTGADTFVVASSPHRPPDAPSSAITALDLEARTAAWNAHDVRALCAPLGPLRLHLAGVARPLVAADEIMAGLTALADRSQGLRVAPAAVARSAAAIAIEWVGTVGTATAIRRFAFVELCTSLPELREWRLLFDTSGL